MYPKILIISETFKSKSGGGITLSNLFKGYPIANLANAIDSHFISEIESDKICNKFYALGNEEKKIISQLSFLQNRYKSGPFTFSKNSNRENKEKIRGNLKYKLKHFINPVLNFFGVNHFLFHYELSPQFKKWITEFEPDIIYSQLSSIEMMDFTNKLVEFTGAKSAIHIMDDWPETLGRNELFSNYWRKRVKNEFEKIVKKTDLLLSISEGMSEEYKLRYGREFIPFHNPINISNWSLHSKKNWDINKDDINLLYAGRIGTGISTSLITCARAIDGLSKMGVKIRLNVQTTSLDSNVILKLKQFNCVRINSIVSYDKLPEVFSNADLLLMPFDFTSKGIRFLKYSMPTKASEYMISGTPIIVFCNCNLSIYKHAEKYNWAYLIGSNDVELLKMGIMDLIESISKRESFAKKAIQFASENFDDVKVRQEFHQIFIDCCKK